MDSLGASDLEVLQFIQTMQECCAQLRTQKQSVKEVAEPQEDSGDDYYDEDSDDSDDIAAMRARRGLPPKPAAKAAEESKSEGGQHLVANLVFTFDADLFLTQSDKSFYEELIMSQSDFVLEVHANESGYSKDLDGTLILKKNLFEESLLTKTQHKANTKFKVKETAVDYFEYFTF
uniref:Uncharacterized protein n=1 Tax=Euplotes crassus TaxID=5936 RepID=A0A7S3P1J3_EUPCR|mmetsp:Transcript_39963/g.39538  ORF Transcript_39963/g.39538 Transcript_39963/m.39538 type:complete len:176 (+) Transcript_39963:540-1067(+)